MQHSSTLNGFVCMNSDSNGEIMNRSNIIIMSTLLVIFINSLLFSLQSGGLSEQFVEFLNGEVA